MEVFLIPTTSADRYELYYEPPDATVVEDEEDTSRVDRFTFGLYGRVRRSFSEMLLEAEQWRHRRHEAHPEPAGLMARARRRVMGFIVERIAEQRLLWHLRRTQEVRAAVPDDVEPERAAAIFQAMLQADRDRHLKWLAIDTVLLIPAAALTVVPGPNVLGLYFTFQVVSHFLSWRGAQQGLALLPWQTTANAELTNLRQVLGLAAPHRHRRFHEVAARLGLEHLPTFLEDVAARLPRHG